MKKLPAALAGFAVLALIAPMAATAAPWSLSVSFSNVVVSSPVAGGG